MIKFIEEIIEKSFDKIQSPPLGGGFRRGFLDINIYRLRIIKRIGFTLLRINRLGI